MPTRILFIIQIFLDMRSYNILTVLALVASTALYQENII